jgi:hypothetical protein
VSLWQTSKEILDEPRKGWYVKKLSLPGYWVNRDLRDENVRPSPSDEEKETFKKAARKLAYGYSNFSSKDLAKNVEDRIYEVGEGGAVAILLHHLPYLTTIKLTECQTECLESTMERIAKSYGDRIAALKLPLQHLKTAAVSYAISNRYSSAS